MGIFLCSFSGAAAELKVKERTADNVLRCLEKDPKISTWDMSEHLWLWREASSLIKQGMITEDKTAEYPWHRYIITDKGTAHLTKLAVTP